MLAVGMWQHITSGDERSGGVSALVTRVLPVLFSLTPWTMLAQWQQWYCQTLPINAKPVKTGLLYQDPFVNGEPTPIQLAFS